MSANKKLSLADAERMARGACNPINPHIVVRLLEVLDPKATRERSVMVVMSLAGFRTELRIGLHTVGDYAIFADEVQQEARGLCERVGRAWRPMAGAIR